MAAFPLARRVKGKTPFAGGIRRRWKAPDGTIYEWDYRHVAVEIYDAGGKDHRGRFDPLIGRQIGDAQPDRTVEP